jgi:signal transduction histidine kinase
MMPRPARHACSLILPGLLAATLTHPLPGWPFSLIAVWLAYAGLLETGLGSPSRWAGAASLALQATGLLALDLLSGARPAACLAWSAVFAFQAINRLGWQSGLGVALLAALGCAGVLAASQPGLGPNQWALALAVPLPALALTVWAFMTHAALAAEKKRSAESGAAAMQLAKANCLMQKHAANAELIAIYQERARLARDIHDTIGHSLTAVILQLDALAETTAAGQAAGLESIRQIRQTAADSLSQIRRSIRDFNIPEPVLRHGPDLWRSVIEAFSRAAGVRVVANIGDGLDMLPEALDDAVFRLIQEGLTNAVRHGAPADIEVGVRVIDGFLCVRICDNGRGCADPLPGQGLRGMIERVEQLGGRVEWRSSPGYGFDVGADIPLEIAHD